MDISFVIRLVDEFSGRAKGIKDSLKGIGSAARDGFSSAIKDGFSVKNIDAAGKNAEAALTRARGRMMGAIGQALTLAAPIKMAAGFDQSFKGLEKVLDAPKQRLLALRRYALETSTAIPIAAKSVLELMAEAAQGGVPLADLEKFTTYVANSAVAFDMAGGEIGERFAKLRNVYKLNQDSIEDLGDATNHLSNNMAAKASELTDFTNRAAGAAAVFKLTATQTAAFGASMISAGIVPETAARGFTALATRILSGGKKIDEAFGQIGIKRGAFMKELGEDAPAALQKLFDAMGKSKHGMEALIELVGRDFADDFAKLLGNPELIAQAFDLVADKAAYAGSAVEEAAKQAEGAERKWDLLRNRVSRMAIVLGEQLLPYAIEAADRLGELLDQVVELAQANPELTENIVTGAAGLMAMSVASRVLGYAVAAIRGPLIGLASAFLKFENGRNIATGWRILSGTWRAVAGSASGLASGLMTVVRAIPAFRNGLAGLAMISAAAGGGLAGAFSVIGTVLGSAAAAIGSALAAISAPVWALIAVFVAAGFAVWKFWDRISAFASGFAGPIVDLLSTGAGALLSEIGRLASGFAEMLGIDLSFLDGWKTAITNALDFSGLFDGLSASLASGWEAVKSFFTAEKLSDSAKEGFRLAGENFAKALIEGFKAAIEGLIAVAGNISSRISSAFSSVTNAVSWPWGGPTDQPPAGGEPPAYQPQGADVQGAVRAVLEDNRPPQTNTVNVTQNITTSDPLAAGRAASASAASALSGALNDGGNP